MYICIAICIYSYAHAADQLTGVCRRVGGGSGPKWAINNSTPRQKLDTLANTWGRVYTLPCTDPQPWCLKGLSNY